MKTKSKYNAPGYFVNGVFHLTNPKDIRKLRAAVKYGLAIDPQKVSEEGEEFRRLVWQGLTADAIAARLNLPLANVKHRLKATYSAIRKLQNIKD